MRKKLGLEGFAPQGRRVLMRVDFNVPLDNGRAITDDTRIRAALPSLERITGGGGSVVLMSHLGRPKGRIDPAASLRPVADRLAELVEVPVRFATDTVGPDAAAKAAALRPGEILLLENLRFNPGETADDDAFARALAAFGDVYVNDAFGTAHRAHASTVGVTRHVKEARAGLLMHKELAHLGALLTDPARPFVAVLGGAKVAGKVEVITSLLDRVDTLLLGGGMIFTFFHALGLGIGKSLLDADSVEVVRDIQARAKGSRAQLVLPEDVVVADQFADHAARREVLATDIPDGWLGLDIGPRTVARYRELLGGAKAIFWNGPMGVFELPSFAAGTRAVGEAVAQATDGGALSVVGGGDSVAAVNQLGLADRISHISTGGGASLEFMAGLELPGVAALTDA
ncbi:MAG: phosphoglycerate kinase [Candidatus Krumholzibacteriia bacterium]